MRMRPAEMSETIDDKERAEGAGVTPYDLVGGAEAVRHLADRLYDIMDEAPEAAGIRAMHGDDLRPIKDSLFEFLSAWLGGPQTYFERADRPCIRSAHRPFAIGPAERDQWLTCMRRALVETGVPEPVRKLLDQPLFRMADMLRSR